MTSIPVRRVVVEAQEVQRRFPVLQIVALAALFGWGTLSLPAFAGRPSIDSMLVLASFLGIAAVGQTIVILIGGIDLSIPNVITAGNLLTTLLGGKHWSFGEIVAAILGGAVVVGAANGFLAHHFRVPALIITLGSGSVVVGAVLAGTHASVYGSVPGWFTHFVSPASTVAGLHIPQVVLLDRDHARGRRRHAPHRDRPTPLRDGGERTCSRAVAGEDRARVGRCLRRE